MWRPRAQHTRDRETIWRPTTHRLTYHQPKPAEHHHATGDSETPRGEAWCKVSNRRCAHHQHRHTRKPHPLSSNKRSQVDSNRYSWLNLEEDEHISYHEFESPLGSNLFTPLNTRASKTFWKRNVPVQNKKRLSRNSKRFISSSKVHVSGEPSRATAVILPATLLAAITTYAPDGKAPPTTAPDPLVVSLDAAPQSSVGGSVEPPTTQSQGNHHNHVDSSAYQPKTVTWADILKKNKDNSLPNIDQAVPFSATTDKVICLTEDKVNLSTTEENRAEPDLIFKECETFHFFGEEGFDSIKIESKLFKFAVKNKEIVIFEIKRSMMRRISFNLDLATQIIHYISQLKRSDHYYGQRRRFGPITISSEINNSGCFLKIAKEKGSFILIPTGPKNFRLLEFLAMFSNIVGISVLVQEEPMHLEPETTTNTVEPTSISKLIFNFHIQGAYAEQQQTHTSEILPKIPLIQAYSDASDSYNPSDDSFFSDDFLGHATESERRPPISNQDDIWDSKFNRVICHKSKFITSDNCLPTDNLNTQLKIYKKSQKNKRRHSMKTRSQSKQFPWA
ncbi:unnamed protein product [Cuscuta epithymum]|uniref:Uncharacterized protein n=1 Tax=Cuscuta epithymum TaxID=186058 RepID=A0AAV0BYT9_9ASTE|nr:unnamed protein product [Cuscuta epithymum]